MPTYACVCIHVRIYTYYSAFYVSKSVVPLIINPPIRQPIGPTPSCGRQCTHLCQVCGVYVEVVLEQPSAPLPDVPALLDGIFALISACASALTHSNTHASARAHTHTHARTNTHIRTHTNACTAVWPPPARTRASARRSLQPNPPRRRRPSHRRRRLPPPPPPPRHRSRRRRPRPRRRRRRRTRR